jgi:hypothetical protein
MQVSLIIVRYKKRFIPFAFIAMAFHRLPLWMNRSIHFYKLMGCGKNGTFDRIPDLQQWALLTVSNSKDGLADGSLPHNNVLRETAGAFISRWYAFFRCETCTFILEPVESHGLWDGKKVFGQLPAKSDYGGKIAVLTRATIRINKLKHFWQNVAPVASKMNTAKGFLFSAGVGEIPWIKQATFSVWQSKEHMKAFAYGMKEHAEVIQKTRKQNWYSEDMFTRFKIISVTGTIKGEKPVVLST